jgi:hypothetical protein
MGGFPLRAHSADSQHRENPEVPCNNARVHLALLAFDRESAIISALIALIVAGVIVSLGAWVLLRRERRRGR